MTHEQFRSCIEACQGCATACEQCAAACLGEAEVRTLAECIQLDRDCADICTLAAQIMARGSRFNRQVCLLCADICDACAAECEKFSHLDHCRDCAKACRRCADECRAMVQQRAA